MFIASQYVAISVTAAIQPYIIVVVLHAAAIQSLVDWYSKFEKFHLKHIIQRVIPARHIPASDVPCTFVIFDNLADAVCMPSISCIGDI